MQSLEYKWKNLQVILICGNYNSGKSMLANTHFKEWKRINRNEIRRFIRKMTSHGEEWKAADYSPEMEHLVKHIEINMFRYYLEKGEKVVIDSTSISKKNRERYLAEIKRFKCSCGCIFMDLPISTLIQRNRRRPPEEQVPEQVLSTLHVKRELPELEEGYQLIRVIDS